MGFGEFGNNGSVHWRIVHTADQRAGGFVRGRDPNVVQDSKEAHVQPSAFTVRLRFPSTDEARRALEAAIKSIDGSGTATVQVPAIPRQNADDPKLLPWEIHVRW